MQARPGTYALILRSSADPLIEIGKLGKFLIQPGYYVYAGSAFGPGGIKARIAHHARISQRPHWHIDYLRSALLLDEAWYSYDSDQNEHQWADILTDLKGATLPIEGFGASDCSCKSHLLVFPTRPSVSRFRDRLRSKSNGHGKIFSHKFKRHPYLFNSVKTGMPAVAEADCKPAF
ncbi:MAG: GIY-YIG nuclease family protein [Desulfobacterales bacterium]|jgi:Uri superfamily endonuclease